MRFRFITIILLLWTSMALAQVGFTFKLEFTECLEWAPVTALVTLENKGTEPARLGADYQLSFEVRDERGTLVRSRAESELNIPLQLDPGSSVEVTNDLHCLFCIDRQGQYVVTAKLQTHNRVLASEKVFLDVMAGSELAHAEVTLPDGSERRYELRQMSRDRKSYLFLRVDDPAKGLNYGVYELGRYVPLKKPELQVDQNGLAHILHLAAPNQFLHSVFSPTGDLVAQQPHSGDSTAVRLNADPESGYRVIGEGITPPRDPMIETLPGRRRL